MEPVNTRLSLLEASNESSQTQVANLQQDVGQLRRDMAKQAEELATVQRQMENNNAGAERQIAVARQEAMQDRLAATGATEFEEGLVAVPNSVQSSRPRFS